MGYQIQFSSFLGLAELTYYRVKDSPKAKWVKQLARLHILVLEYKEFVAYAEEMEYLKALTYIIVLF